ncbi:MAG: 2-amino-4-hydroxy-6-hydroxymethyldihydropteridine diphosphokinase [Spirochaetes bacterium]|nr:2-amino-4-hydroxy-6-hydroxymethyldihydropteridine diphosphokinase [Spirochaetota bacterium]
MAFVYIGLGSNLGDRKKNIDAAADAIASNPGTIIIKKSTIIETDPVDYLDQPRFLNQVILIETDLTPLDLLRHLQQTETGLGRTRALPKGPRTIDLDILLYDTIVMETRDITIPHPQIKNRIFILKHLVELTPELTDPVSGDAFRTFIK